jgi:uncharacterized spore protein YtfJ
VIADDSLNDGLPTLPPDQDQERRINSCLTRSSEMSSLALLQSLKESILSQANVKAIYGEPIAAHGRTVIPVAKIMYGYGAGAGTGGVGDSSARGEGGGGGGGVRAIPVGVTEVSDQQTRFVPITDRKRLAGAVLAGIGLGMFLGWRRRR